jgi:tetratricopeptide (TPR) repeat protein
LGNLAEARECYGRAAQAPPDYCFPSRIEEMIFLKAATEANTQDARPFYYLGNLLYDRRRHREGVACWERSSSLDPSFPTVWRNLGIGYFNVLENPAEACRAFDKALKADPTDARVLYERDQLWKRNGEAPERRLAALEKFSNLVRERDDLSMEMAALYNQTGQYEKALALISSRKFQPWEGGEGLVLVEYVRSLVALGRRMLAAGDAVAAVRWFGCALASPDNLGEACHLLSNQSDVQYWMGVAYQAAGYEVAARRLWTKAATAGGDFRQMSVQPFSEMTYYKALALAKLGRSEEADKLLRDLLAHARTMKRHKARIDYFATSLPAMLLFDDDLQKRNLIDATFLEAQARLGLRKASQAHRLLRQVLTLDRNHALAADLIRELEPAASPHSAIPA